MWLLNLGTILNEKHWFKILFKFFDLAFFILHLQLIPCCLLYPGALHQRVSTDNIQSFQAEDAAMKPQLLTTYPLTNQGWSFRFCLKMPLRWTKFTTVVSGTCPGFYRLASPQHLQRLKEIFPRWHLLFQGLGKLIRDPPRRFNIVHGKVIDQIETQRGFIPRESFRHCLPDILHFLVVYFWCRLYLIQFRTSGWYLPFPWPNAKWQTFLFKQFKLIWKKTGTGSTL